VLETTAISKCEGLTAWIPAREAAMRLKVTHQRVYQLLRDGLINGRKIGSTWLVSQRSVEARIALLRSEGGV